MRRLPLAAALLLLGSSARAGDPAPAAPKAFYDVAYENGADFSGAAKILRTLRKLQGEYPGLVTPQILSKVVFVSPERGLGNVKYCWSPEGVVVYGVEGCDPGAHMTIVADVELAESFEGKYEGFYRKGAGLEALLFHELMHGWAFTHPKDLEEYEIKVSEGRRARFDRKYHRLMKPLAALEHVLHPARLRVEMGDGTREQWKELGGSELEQLAQDELWKEYHDKMTLEQAKEIVAKNERKLHELGPDVGARIARYSARKNAPRRGARDVHAAENAQEWFAYGGEISNYAAAPQDYLTEKERAWWKALDSELRGGSRP